MLKGKKGVTLAELIVSIGILGLILAPVSMIMYTGYKSYFVEENTTVTQEKARQAMDSIIEDLRRLEFENRVYNPDKTLKPLADPAGGRLTLTRDGQVYYYLDGSVLKKLDNGNVSKSWDGCALFEINEVNNTGSNVVNLTIGFNSGIGVSTGRTVNLNSSYRRKSPSIQ